MIGYVTIRGVIKDGHTGLIIDCNVRDASTFDKYLAVSSLERALQLSRAELTQYDFLRDKGFFENATSIEDLGDKEDTEDA